jgi:hypothetical protein
VFERKLYSQEIETLSLTRKGRKQLVKIFTHRTGADEKFEN